MYYTSCCCCLLSPFPSLPSHPTPCCCVLQVCCVAAVRATGIKMNKKFTRRRILCAKCSKYKQQQFSTAPYNAVMILSIIKRVAAVLLCVYAPITQRRNGYTRPSEFMSVVSIFLSFVLLLLLLLLLVNISR